MSIAFCGDCEIAFAGLHKNDCPLCKAKSSIRILEKVEKDLKERLQAVEIVMEEAGLET